MRYSETQLLQALSGYLWPFLRIGALFVSIPVFSAHGIPMRIRSLLALAITAVIAPTLPPMPDIPLFSFTGFLVGFEQVLIGLLIGFILNLVFEAIVFGGQNIAFNMGLGFASLIDPRTGVQVPVIAQFYLILVTLLFLNMDGHLMAIQLLADSFKAIPVDAAGLSRERFWSVSIWSARLFAAGMLLSLPIITALLLVNLGFGVASRAAPQLNIFSVGFPVSLLVGLVLIWLSLANVMHMFTGFLEEGLRLIQQILQ